MTYYSREETSRPEVGTFYGFDHIRFYVSNAKQASSFYTSRFGFHRVAYQGLETGNRDYCTHVVKQGRIILAFTSPLNPGELLINDHIKKHGDGVYDVAFTVDDARGIWEKATSRGATSIREPEELKDSNGTVIVASVRTYGDTVHTFVQRTDYTGVFLPGFKEVEDDIINSHFTPMNLDFIDHIVGNQPDDEMTPTVEWYMRMLDFHRYWSVDDKQILTEFSALRSIVVADYDEVIKMPINEPAPGLKKSQIQEYVEYYGGPGVQHIALNTQDIIAAITALKNRGVEFLTVPENYYSNLRARLAHSPVQVMEDMDTIQALNILIDFDDAGYLLQIFTKPVEDRPTLFFEVIQRHNNDGFGIGNFKALFEAIEQEQQLRGNLT
jgi:4-hydroxyphenylpyruvate dioxygenase